MQPSVDERHTPVFVDIFSRVCISLQNCHGTRQGSIETQDNASNTPELGIGARMDEYGGIGRRANAAFIFGDQFFPARRTTRSPGLARKSCCVRETSVRPNGWRCKTFKQLTALYLAIWKGHSDAVEFLVRHGADIELKDQVNFAELFFTRATTKQHLT